jgi:hypothetical protein
LESLPSWEDCSPTDDLPPLLPEARPTSPFDPVLPPMDEGRLTFFFTGVGAGGGVVARGAGDCACTVAAFLAVTET